MRDESGLPLGVHSDRIAAVVREAPIADAGPPVLACTNQTVRLDGSGSSDADGAVNAFSWNFGDGSSGGGERPTHVFERPGTYTVTLTITGDARGSCGALDTDETTVDRRRGAAHRDRRPGPGRRRRRDRASTRRSPATPTCAAPSFDWDFGDGATATGPTVEHAFADAGRPDRDAARVAARRQRGLRHDRDPAHRHASTRRPSR